MPTITVTATVHRNSHGFFKDIVSVVIAGREFVYECNSPEQAREVVEKTIKELGLWQSTSTD